VERLSRLIVLVSMLLAGAAHAALAGQVLPALPWAAAAAFAISFALAKASLPLALIPALLLAYIAPAVAMVTFGSPDYHHILVWLALLAGAVVAASDWSRWHTPQFLKAPLAAWAIVVAVTWPIVAGREIDFSTVAARTLDTPNALLGGPPALTAAWVTSVALGQLIGVLWLDLLWARFGTERLRRAERVVLVPLAISAAIASAAGVYQRYVDLNWLVVGDWPSLGRAAGLMLDANSFGTAAAIWAPLCLALVWRLGRRFWLGLAFAALLLAGMWVSGSRTALLIAAVGFTAVGVALFHRVRAWQARIAPVALLLTAAGLILFVAVRSDDRSNPLTRALEILPRAETGGLATFADDLWNRKGYGVAAARAISEHPWTGLGVGAFNQLSTDYYFLSSGLLIPPDNAQNWWRHQIAELGVIGAAPSILLSLLVVLLIWRRQASADHRDAATVVRGVLVGLGLASLLGLTTQHPALWLTFATLLYWLGALVDPAPAAMRPAWLARAGWAAACAIGVLVAAGQWRSATGDLRVPTRAVRVGFPYAYGFSTPETDAALGPVRWTGRHAVGVVRAEHAYFAVTVTPHPQAVETPARIRVWRGTQVVADVVANGPEAITRILRVPDGARFLMVETDISRSSSDGRGLKVAARWLREAPPDAAPGTVVP
jgi:O-antigen ligase